MGAGEGKRCGGGGGGGVYVICMTGCVLGMCPICSKIYLFCFLELLLLFCSQTAPILLGIMLGVARQIFNYIRQALQKRRPLDTVSASSANSNSLSRSHTLWLSHSSSLAATRSLSFRRRIRSDLTFPGEIRGPRRLQSVQKRNQLTRPSRLTAFSASTGCLAVFDSRMLCHSFPQGPNTRSLRTSSDCTAADASTWTWQLARACMWAHIIFCSRCAAPYFAGIMLTA